MLAYYIIAFERNLKNVKVNMELEALNLRIVSLIIFSNALISSDHLLKSAWIGSFQKVEYGACLFNCYQKHINDQSHY
jgi:hypothetical protein